jgi:hypothetical protein
MPNYICKIREDIPAGVLQILDLDPNTSQKNLVYDPTGQTLYVSFRPQNDTVATTGAGPILTSAAYSGLAAYLIDNIENSGTAGTPALTATQANNIAAAIIADMDAGNALTSTAIDALINAEAGVTGAGLQVGNSTGGVGDVLLILAGEVYTLPAGAQVEDGANAFDLPRKGAFAAAPRVKTVETSGYFNISLVSGHLAAFKSATYEYLGATGAAIVVYDAEGNVL